MSLKNPKTVKVKVITAVSNNGDGSASVRFFKTRAAAQKWEQDAVDAGYDGWAEPSVSEDELTFVDGVLTGYDDEGCEIY